MTLPAIDAIPAMSRITEIVQHINDIEKNFGTKTPAANFQSILEQEMLKHADKIQPIEEFLAANRVQPVNENAAANAEKVKSSLQNWDGADDVEIFEPPETNSNLTTRNTRQISADSSNTTEELIEAAARKFGVEPDLVRAIAMAESNMNQDARSNVGAIGVMQLMPETAGSLGVDPYDERQNINGGAKYIRQMLDQFNGNVKNAIAAYNAGPGAVQKYGGIPPYSETQNYVGRVMDFYVR